MEPVQWTWHHTWRLLDAPVLFYRHEDEWGCSALTLSIAKLFEGAGIPLLNSRSPFRGNPFGPFPSLDEAIAIAASVCGCATRRQQVRVYSAEGVPLNVHSFVGPSGARTYFVAAAIDLSDASGRLEARARRLRHRLARERWPRTGTQYPDLTSARTAIDEWLSKERMLSSAPSFLAFQTRARALRRLRASGGRTVAS